MDTIDTALDVAKKIQFLIEEIQDAYKLSESLTKAKAEATRDYDRELAVAILKLRDTGMPVSICEKVSKGNVADYKYALEVAEGNYKAHFSTLECLRQCLNGYQSINRFLSVV